MSEGAIVDGQPRKRAAPQPLVLRDIDQMLAPLPLVLEVPLSTYLAANGLIDDEEGAE